MSFSVPLQLMTMDGKGGARLVEIKPLPEFLAQNKNVYWLHIDYSKDQAIDWLQDIEWMDPIVKISLLEDNSRPRHELFHEDGCFLSLRGVNLNPGASPDDMVGVRIWATSQYIITSNHRPLVSLQRIKGSLDKSAGPDSISKFIRTLIALISQHIDDVVENMEDMLEQLEDNVEHMALEKRKDLSEIRRQAIRLKRFLAPQQDALQHLLQNPPSWLKKEDKRHIRENMNQFKRYLELLDSIRDRAIVAQEEVLANLSEILNHRMYILSIVTTFFLPLGFLTGLFGINVGGMPGAQSRYGFLLFSLITTFLAILLVVLFKKKKWL